MLPRVPERSANMPEVGDKLELTIEDIAYRGAGIARHDGLVIFVNRVAPGERVECEILKRKSNFAEAVLIRILQPSPNRIEPCAQISGGVSLPSCVYDFLDYGTEVEIKHRQMCNLLRNVDGIGKLTLPPFASPLQLNYRNKIVFHAQRAGREPAVIGYYGTDNRTVIDMERCPLAHDAINFAWAARRDAARKSLENGQILSLRWTDADGVSSWVDKPAADAPMLTETSLVGPLSVPLDGFYQVNSGVADELVRQVVEWFGKAAAESGTRQVLDLYCGVGIFGLACAVKAGAGPVTGIEGLRSAVAAARANARNLGIDATFTCAKVENAARGGLAAADELARSIVIVDPPRKGMEPNVVTTLGAARVPHIIYAACDPATLARDLKRFESHGYRLRGARMLDMFPRTAHFETAVWLSRG